MTERPTVSVVIPTRNRWSLLERTLESALRQQDVHHEVIVVDDGSTDETPARLAAHGDDRMRFVRHQVNQGVACARNRGIREARGDWVAFLDDDDTWSPVKLRTQLEAARTHAASFAYGSALHVDERAVVLAVERAPAPHELGARLLTSQNPLPAGCSNVLVQTKMVRQLGGFDCNLFHLTDWDMWLRLLDAGPAVACPEILVAYLKHSANMLSLRERDIFREFSYLAAKHRLAGEARGLRFDGVGLSRWVADGHRRAGRRREAARAYLRGALTYRSPGNALRALNVLVNPRAAGPDRRGAQRGLSAPAWFERAADPSAPR